MAGTGGLPGHEYHTFPTSTWGSASTYSNRGELTMGHREIMEVPRRSISWSAGSGYITFKIGGHAPITQSTIFKFLSIPKGNKTHPVHVGGFYFPRPHPSGCLPSIQALKGRQEHIPLFSHAWFQQITLSLYLQLNWRSSPVEPCFHQGWASTLTFLI